MKEGRISNMGIFSNSNRQIAKYDMEDLEEDIEIVPCTSVYGFDNIDYIEESNNFILDTYEDWCNTFKEVWIREVALYREDEYYAITENFIEDLIMGVKKFLVKLWRAIASMFKSFSMMLNKYMLNDKSFLNKYRKELLSKNLDSDFSFSGYIFTIDENEIKSAIRIIMQDPENNSNTITQSTQSQYYGQGNIDNPTMKYSNVEDKIDKLRNHVIQQFSKRPTNAPDRKVDAKDFTEEINACLRNGKDSEEEIDNKLDVQGIVNELETSQNTKRIMNTSLKEGKRAIDLAQKETDSRLTGLSRMPVENPDSTTMDKRTQDVKKRRTNKDFRSDQMKELSYFSKYIQQSRVVLVALEGCILKALKDRSRQNKSAIIEVIQYKSSNESTITESTSKFLENPFQGIDFK